MTEPKQHHYLPRFYLEGFTGPGKRIWVANLARNSLRAQLPRKVARRNRYYSLERADGSRSNVIEDQLGKIEDKASNAIRGLSMQMMPSGTIESDLVYFVATLMLRTPGAAELNNQHLRETLTALAEGTFTLDQPTRARMIAAGATEAELEIPSAAEVRRSIAGGELETQFDRNKALGTFAHAFPRVAARLYEMDWLYLFNRSDVPFTTTDYPFAVLNPGQDQPSSPYGIPWTSPDLDKFVPLSAGKALIFSGLKRRRRRSMEVCEEQVHAFNLRAARYVTELLLGEEKEVRRVAERFGNTLRD